MSAAIAEDGSIVCVAQASTISAVRFSVHHHIEDAAAAWQMLQSLPNNSLHQTLEWCRAWYETQEGKPLLILGSQNGAYSFLLPLFITSRYGIKTAHFPGNSFNNLNTGLFSAEFRLSDPEQELWLQRIKNTLAGHADVLHLNAVPKEWRGTAHALHDLPAVEHVNHSFQLPLLGTFDETLAQVNAKRRRKKFRQQTRRIGELGTYEVYTPTSNEEQHALLDVFFEQKRERFRSQGLPDVFSDDRTQRFFHALLDAQRSGDNYPLRLSAIRLNASDGQFIPAICGLSRKGDHIICQFGSIDESRAPDTSPGELLFWHVIEKACQDGAKLFDFGLGDQLYKRSWCPVETVHYDLIVPVSPIGWLAAIAKRTQISLKSILKKNRALYRLLQRVRAAKIR